MEWQFAKKISFLLITEIWDPAGCFSLVKGLEGSFVSYYAPYLLVKPHSALKCCMFCFICKDMGQRKGIFMIYWFLLSFLHKPPYMAEWDRNLSI